MERGRKRVRRPDTWKRETTKRRKNSGLDYQSVTGRFYPAKVFDVSTECCRPRGRNRCTRVCSYKQLPEEERRSTFNRFWNLGTYNAQNSFLFGLLEMRLGRATRRVVQADGQPRRRLKFKYFFRRPGGDKVPVCQAAFCLVLGIKPGRIRTVQMRDSCAK